jgi:hypothetical protein
MVHFDRCLQLDSISTVWSKVEITQSVISTLKVKFSSSRTLSSLKSVSIFTFV